MKLSKKNVNNCITVVLQLYYSCIQFLKVELTGLFSMIPRIPM